MGTALVATKLHAPSVRPGLVPRRKLLEQLCATEGLKLTLVCAPAGWGKTVLLGEWRASAEETRSFAWLSLDRGDDDPTRFWAYVIEALRGVDSGLGVPALAALPGSAGGLIDSVVGPLLNDLGQSTESLVLVLDDYHLVRDERIHESVAFLLHRLPANLHVTIATRSDPPLPLGRSRAAGELLEIRGSDLRFDAVETQQFLNETFALGLANDEVALLQARTEGWPAGLQLAALSLRVRDDRHAFVEAFAGDDRQIVEYLHEVIDEHPALRSFLLQTSILEEMCTSLCEAVTADADAGSRLDAVRRSNLFLVELDARGEWFRYHHLFGELLRHELRRAEPQQIALLHRRASAWHSAAGNTDRAIAHATAAGAFEEAGDLIARHWRAFFNLGQAETVARWIDLLPHETVVADARLCLARASTALFLGRLDEGEDWLVAAESAPPSGPLHAGIASVAANVAFLRAAGASLAGDVGASVEAGRLAVALHPPDRGLGWAIANINLGHALYYSGELVEAARALEEAGRSLTGADAVVPTVTAAACLALVRADAGELEQAEHALREAEEVVARLHLDESPWAALPRLARGRLLELRDDLAGAEAALARAAALAARGRRRLERAHALLLQARVERRRRQVAQARTTLREARRLIASCPDPGFLVELLGRLERALQLKQTPPARTPATPDADLSEREVAVLRLLATGLSRREIGSQLYVSLNTVKSHSRNIFRKLGVDSRADAVGRARELGLL
jgi:LuxR family maltose regulon positive regulatory protein